MVHNQCILSYARKWHLEDLLSLSQNIQMVQQVVQLIQMVKLFLQSLKADQKFLLERRDILGTDDRDAIRNDKASREYMINWRNKQSQIRVEDVFKSLSFTCEHEILKQYIDKNNVNIMGHSFGGTSVLGQLKVRCNNV